MSARFTPRDSSSAAWGETTTFRSSTTVPIDATSGMVVTSIWSAIRWTALRSARVFFSTWTVIIGVDGTRRASTSSMRRGSPSVTFISATPA